MPTTPVKFHRRLTVRLMLFLSLALVPVGLLAVLQTHEVVNRIAAQTEARLADETSAAARQSRENILWAFGAATGLGQAVAAYPGNTANCIAGMKDFVGAHPDVASAGVILPDGTISCASTGESYDVSDWPVLQDLLANPRTFVNYSSNPVVSHRPVLISVVPVIKNEKPVAFVFVSLEQGDLAALGDTPGDAVFKTFNRDGTVLTSSDGDEEATSLLPADRELASLATDTGMTFRADSRGGIPQVYSVSPIIDGTVYAIGIWAPDVSQPGLVGMAVAIPLFPVLMWLASLLVAYVAVDRLALRHVRRLRYDLRRFARNRSLPLGSTPDMPAEIAEIFDTFLTASETILRDEAELEMLIHDKNVLLKEVHHRVKNNLQLISSIMNMQMRKLKAPEAKHALKRLQARVLSLATVHRTLYRTENLGAVQAGPLLKDLVDQLAEFAGPTRRTEIETRFDRLRLYPDQAVPISLLTTEAITNALKYAGNEKGRPGWIRVTLVDEGGGHACLTVENSKGPVPVMPGDAISSSGLGTNLIRAFASQLGATAQIEDGEHAYHLTCRFVVQGFQEDPFEDPLPEEDPEEEFSPA
ncbi:sensor histidine kinase [Mangrovicoccus sp. HB161399]|uniref:sensor histidine kinase n=1 Tax=Mangrovicoccus sp. HB161399 TaxID=2720392 RepID=UPI00155708D8